MFSRLKALTLASLLAAIPISGYSSRTGQEHPPPKEEELEKENGRLAYPSIVLTDCVQQEKISHLEFKVEFKNQERTLTYSRNIANPQNFTAYAEIATTKKHSNKEILSMLETQALNNALVEIFINDRLKDTESLYLKLPKPRKFITYTVKFNGKEVTLHRMDYNVQFGLKDPKKEE